MSSRLERKRKAVIIGAGPVGCLAASALFRHGWNVAVYESRPGLVDAQIQTFVTQSNLPDLRLPSSKVASQKRSINLAISHRGIAALEVVSPAAAQRFLKDAIPMSGRMIHTPSGELDSQKYDRDGQVGIAVFAFVRITDNIHVQCINSINRALLNEGLLDEASASDHVQISFNHRVIAIDFDHKMMTVQDIASNLNFNVNFDFLIGADGSYSITRQQMMRVARQVDPSLTGFMKHKSSF